MTAAPFFCASSDTCVILSSYRYLEKMMQERGLTVDHTCVQSFAESSLTALLLSILVLVNGGVRLYSGGFESPGHP